MKRNDLVVFSLERWDDIWRRNQYFVDGLLSAEPDLRVLFVEPSHDVLHSTLRGGAVGRGAGLRVVEGYDQRLWRFEPTKVLPRVMGGLADALLRRSVLNAMQRLHVEAPVLWVNDPAWAGLVQEQPTWPALYDITDDWTVADRSERELERLRRNEGVLLEHAHVVVVCSTSLVASKGTHREVVHVSNAVDVTRYRQPVARPDDLPPGRTAVYVGTLHEDRLDAELAIRTAERLRTSGARLVLVGPNLLSPERSAALVHSGAILTGSRPYDRVPAYLQHATALVVPHARNAFTDSLDPIKLYEYLAVGRPIVSTPVAGFRELASPGVEVAESHAFPDAVVRVVSQNPSSIVHDGVPDWASRVAQMRDLLEDLRTR